MNTEKTTGSFKPSKKFIEFVGGKGHVNFISNQATLEGKYLSGLDMDDLNFKLTIYEDGTVDFDEIETTRTSESDRERFLNIILDKTLIPYRNRTVVNELPFLSVQKIKDKNVPLYLAVEHIKPIDKLSSLFDESPLIANEISDDAMENLNELLNSWFLDEDSTKEVQEITNEEDNQINDAIVKDHDNVDNKTLESFNKMKEDKLNELKSKKTKREKDIMNYSFQISSIEKNLEEAKNELKLIESRIHDIQPTDSPNGYYFNISEKQNETVILEPEIEKIIKNKVSKVKGINVEAFMKLFTSGEYHIKIANKKDDGFSLVEDFKDLPTDILEKFSSLNLKIDDKKMIYLGELSWGELVNKMIKIGFEQNPEFDKFCGSNSYESIS